MNPVSFIKVNSGNVCELSSLKVSPHQCHLIDSNAFWLAEVLVDGDSLSFGIYENNRPVGLITVIDPRTLEADDHFQPDCLYVYRLMIDQHHQGRQLGTSAVRFSQQLATVLGLRGVSLTTMAAESGNALNFYLSLNFKPTGRELEDETELLWLA
ncbi:GNAT family N-acetyltransferase [Aliamphritea spongicola]|uniref:GNAT family N-acetyltransferase n=1 Tax=Aliamphritea spongicola TaxID=707589 RepID=UPI00196B10BA|nr:GNAT family N-acetyltransferase [Aliamphritea spongicola]MBN3562704.1 GNAT family N-acetyltransferase [Aliamphritea spongicola]